MIKIGLTGTIGSGKTYVAKIMEEYDIPVLDLDKVAKDIRNNEAKADIIAYFGNEILTSEQIDPKKLGAIVFADNQKKKKLESFIHPLVIEKMLAFFDAHEHYKYVVVEQAILFELGWEKYFDEIWLVTCSQDVALERLMKYRNLEKPRALQILNNQQTNDSKMKYVDEVIYNDADEQAIKNQLDSIFKRRSYDTSEG